MKNLHFSTFFKNYLYDLDEFISIYDNIFHVFNYTRLYKLSENEIILSLNDKKITLSGTNLKVKQMTKQELLITGHILKVEFSYEE